MEVSPVGTKAGAATIVEVKDECAMIEPPEVKEEQVEFTKISFDKMTNKELNSFDAVFIREDNLFEAAEDQYADVYLDSTIPFFFI